MNRLELAAPAEESEEFYPSSDGEPMAETGLHVDAIVEVLEALRFYYRDRRDVFIGADMFIYYEQGNRDARRAPDILVAFGVLNPRRRNSYFTWIEGVFPQVIFEFSSPKTIREDLTTKRDLYEELGAREYFLFDPPEESLQPRFQGFRKVGTSFVRIAPEADGGMTSHELGVRLVPEDLHLRVYDGVTGKRIPNREEQAAMLHAANERADAERQRADAERQRADAERQRADAQAAEIARLRALLGQPAPPSE